MLPADLNGGSRALLNDAKGRVLFAYLRASVCSCVSVQCL